MTDARQKILAIDDTPANLLTLGAALSREFDLQIATSGGAGLALAEASPPDLILLDVMMPEIDGFEVCRRLKQHPRLNAVPVVFMTALGDADSERTGLALGAADYLAKPLDVETARQRIRNLLEREHLRKELELRELQLTELVRQRTAELERTVQDLEAILYSASHDLRTPLRAINGYAEILRDQARERLTAEDDELLARVAQNAERLGHLIDDIHDYVAWSRQSMTLETVALGPLLAATVAACAGAYPRTKVRIDALPSAAADRQMIACALRNLIDNALKFSAKAAAPEVTVGCSPSPDGMALFVRDNGVGFDMQHANKLFGMFQRLHREPEFPGRGTGLALARRLVERHGGRIRAEAEPGRGATFYVTWPGLRQDAGPPAAGGG